MNRPLRVALAALFAAGLAAQAQAATWTFTDCGKTGATGPDQAACDSAYGGGLVVTVSGGIQTWTVPTTGTYRITAAGAAGASGDPDHSGGRGARVSGLFSLTAGQTLKILVGQQGSGQSSESNGGGGGGSFVVSAADAPMLIAGGGGGTRVGAERNGCRGSSGELASQGSGGSPTWNCPLKSGGAGQGGAVSSGSWGSGGGGFNSDGASDYASGGGLSWANGMLGGPGPDGCDNAADGGFGGGGSGRGCWGGGGGGGYSGGDGGQVAGGGGSYNAGGDPSAAIAASMTGSVVVTDDLTPVIATSVPVPTLGEAALATMAALLAGLGLASMRRRG